MSASRRPISRATVDATRESGMIKIAMPMATSHRMTARRGPPGPAGAGPPKLSNLDNPISGHTSIGLCWTAHLLRVRLDPVSAANRARSGWPGLARTRKRESHLSCQRHVTAHGVSPNSAARNVMYACSIVPRSISSRKQHQLKVTVEGFHRNEKRELNRRGYAYTTPEPRVFGDRGHERSAGRPAANCSCPD